MNDIKIKILSVSLVAIALISAGLLAAKKTSADDMDTFYPPFIQSLSERFNLDESEVKDFFDSEKQTRQQNMQESKENRLSQAVEDGVITDVQKENLLNKWQEMHQEREDQRQTNRKEMQEWMQNEGIDSEKLHDYIGFGPRKGRMMWTERNTE